VRKVLLDPVANRDAVIVLGFTILTQGGRYCEGFSRAARELGRMDLVDLSTVGGVACYVLAFSWLFLIVWCFERYERHGQTRDK
jgi:ribose/xylose/arabinose/galactoside ABC-type transport system permease subunit